MDVTTHNDTDTNSVSATLIHDNKPNVLDLFLSNARTGLA